MNETKGLGILLFEGVEELDFCGPLEVFSVAGRAAGETPFDIFTVAERSPVLARSGLSVNATFSLADAPRADILLVPGGRGVRRELGNQPLVVWLMTRAADADLVLSVCTGALLLAKAGLLSGLEVTTHHEAMPLLEELAPDARVVRERRFVDNGRIILAAGISAGIDMAFHVVERLLGPDVSRITAERMEYHPPEVRG